MHKCFIDYVKEYKFELLDGVGHQLHLEKPELIANKINQFVSETSSTVEKVETNTIDEFPIEQL